MNLDLTFSLILVLLALVSWNIYLTIIGRKKLNEDPDNKLEEINTSLVTQTTSMEGLIRDVALFQEPLSKLNRYLSGGTLAGRVGEWSLEAIINDIFPANKFDTNCEVIPDSNQRVEFAIKLPEGLLPIDAKFPAGLYDTYIEASEQGDRESVNRAINEIRKRVINNARDINDRYMQTGVTIDLGVMYIPSESLMQLIDSIGDLRRDLFRDNRVLVMGPNSLAAYLISIHMGFRNLALNEKADQILVGLGKVQSEFEKFGASTANLTSKAKAMLKAAEEHETRERQLGRALGGIEAIGEDPEE